MYIFLDIDGVLNDVETKEVSYDGYCGIDDKYVELLSKLVQKYNGKLVLTSDWKKDWNKEFELCESDGLYINDKLDSYGLVLEDKTFDKRGILYRGEGICDWLKENNITEPYIILDDNTFDFADLDLIRPYFIRTVDGLDTAMIGFPSSVSKLVEEVVDYIGFIGEKQNEIAHALDTSENIY